jgi:two-component system, LytTR family, sensor kinase
MWMRLSTKRPGWLLLSSGRRLSHKALFWILQIAGWCGFGVMMLGYGLALGWRRTAVEAAAALVVGGIGLTSGYRYLLAALRRAAVNAWMLMSASIALVVLGPCIWFLLQKLVLPATDTASPPQSPDPYVIWPGLTLDMYLFDSVILLSWILLYFGINGWMTLMLERRRVEQAQFTAQTARLAALQSQLEPHFLFNTLNTISSLIVEGRNEQAGAVVTRLGDFLRATLQTTGKPEIALADDLVLVRHYLDIQHIRFGDRLRASLKVEPDVLSAAVPALLLQPLVENAVRHGILPRSSGGVLTISAHAQHGKLHLAVEDDGVGMQASSSSGLGLSNTATRLFELYGAQGQLRVRANSTGGTTVAISIPWHSISTGGALRRQREAEE